MEGQVAIVTGGAAGIGREFVKVLLSRKIKVCIADVDVSQATATAQELSAANKDVHIIAQQCDVTNEKQFEGVIQKTIAQFGRLDILINNAGILDESRWKLMMEINVNGVITGTNLGLKYMDKNGTGYGGLIVNMASVAALFTSRTPLYAASKCAVLGFTRSTGNTSLLTRGVRINAICPAVTRTNLIESVSQQKLACSEDDFQRHLKGVKDATLLEPRQVAQCLPPFLDYVTISGEALMCTTEQPCSKLRMPVDMAEVNKCYVQL